MMSQSESLTEQQLDSSEVYNGALLHVFKDTVALPSGRQSVREWIKHPGASAIVPLFENGDVMLLEQYRYPVREVCLEVPAGKIDSGEHHATTAERELLEETGLKAEQMMYIGPFYPGVGYSDEVIHVYIAKGLSQHPDNMDDDEFVLPKRMPFSEAIAKIATGEIKDGKTIICLMRAWLWQQRE